MIDRWDKYYLSICNAVGKNSRCLSRQIGAILVRDKSIIATGYNGPARGMVHCGTDRFRVDNTLTSSPIQLSSVADHCPRKLLGYKSGQGLSYCIGAHAERNCIANAAKMGVCTDGATLYLDTQVPCKDCLTMLINAGVMSVVCTDMVYYDDLSQLIVANTGMSIREYNA